MAYYYYYYYYYYYLICAYQVLHDSLIRRGLKRIHQTQQAEKQAQHNVARAQCAAD